MEKLSDAEDDIPMVIEFIPLALTASPIEIASVPVA